MISNSIREILQHREKLHQFEYVYKRRCKYIICEFKYILFIKNIEYSDYYFLFVYILFVTKSISVVIDFI